MMLDPDCIRDILFEVEENSTYRKGLIIRADKDNPLFTKYSWDKIIYHINQCVLSNLILDAQIFDSDEYAIIDDFSPDGHEFIANIRKDSNWNTVKKRAASVGSFSLSFLKDIAAEVIADLIKSSF